jgi:predicted nucleic acid-binding Zn ribbon protein
MDSTPTKSEPWLALEGARPGTRRRWYHSDRWAQERQRFGIDDVRPPTPFQEPQPLGAGLQRIFKRLGLENAHIQNVLIDEWSQLVGEAVAKRTRPGIIRDRTLIIYVSGSVWYSELKRIGTKALEKKIVERFGADTISAVALHPDPEG